MRPIAMSATSSRKEQPRLEPQPDACATHRIADPVGQRAVGGSRVPKGADVAATRGLYDPAYDKDSCGVGFIADIKGRKSHRIIEDALTILLNLEHRGAVGADPRAGDGAGILVQIPHAFFSRKARELGFALPAPGEYA